MFNLNKKSNLLKETMLYFILTSLIQFKLINQKDFGHFI